MKTREKSQIKTSSLTIKYAILMAAYWGSCCCINGFASVFLLSRNFTNSQIGIVVALGNVLAVLLSPRVAAIADRSRIITIHHLVLIPSTLFVICMGGLYISGNAFWAVGFIFFLSLGILQLLQPLTNSVSVYYVNQGVNINFGIPRAMGSLTWAILSSILGVVIEKTGENALLITAAITGFLMVVITILFPLIKRDVKEANLQASDTTSTSPAKKNTSAVDFIRIYPAFCLLLVGIVFIFFFQTVSNNYLYQLSDAIGGNTETMGYAFTVQALIEIPPMVLFTFLAKKFSSKSLMIFAFIFFIIKSVAFALVFNPFTLYLTMILQMPSYAVYIPASVNYVNDFMREEDKFQGQAMIVAASTLGAVLGSLLGGIFIEHFGVLPTQKIDLVACIIGGVICIAALMLNKSKKDA